MPEFMNWRRWRWKRRVLQRFWRSTQLFSSRMASYILSLPLLSCSLHSFLGSKPCYPFSLGPFVLFPSFLLNASSEVNTSGQHGKIKPDMKVCIASFRLICSSSCSYRSFSNSCSRRNRTCSASSSLRLRSISLNFSASRSAICRRSPSCRSDFNQVAPLKIPADAAYLLVSLHLLFTEVFIALPGIQGLQMDPSANEGFLCRRRCARHLVIPISSQSQ